MRSAVGCSAGFGDRFSFVELLSFGELFSFLVAAGFFALTLGLASFALACFPLAMTGGFFRLTSLDFLTVVFFPVDFFTLVFLIIAAVPHRAGDRTRLWVRARSRCILFLCLRVSLV